LLLPKRATPERFEVFGRLVKGGGDGCDLVMKIFLDMVPATIAGKAVTLPCRGKASDFRYITRRTVKQPG
jgi:hypothetical protein